MRILRKAFIVLSPKREVSFLRVTRPVHPLIRARWALLQAEEENRENGHFRGKNSSQSGQAVALVDLCDRQRQHNSSRAGFNGRFDRRRRRVWVELNR